MKIVLFAVLLGLGACSGTAPHDPDNAALARQAWPLIRYMEPTLQ